MRVVRDVNTVALTSLNSDKIPVLPTSSSAPLKGRVAYNTTSNVFEYANGSVWLTGGSGMAVGGVLTGTLPNPGLANNVVNTVNLIDHSVTSIKLDANAVNASNIQDGSITSIKLTNTGVGAGTYGDSTHVAQFTVNSEGQVTAASNVAIAGGTVTSIATAGGLTGGPITTTGTISIADTAVTPGTYGGAGTVPVITVNQKGQITGVTTAAPSSAVPFSMYYVSGADTVVNNNTEILFNGTQYFGTGTMNAGTGVWTSNANGVYMISFSGIGVLGRAQYQLLLNGGFGVGSPLGFCEAGNDSTAGPPAMSLIIGTASLTIVQNIPSGQTLQICNIGGASITVKGNTSGPATVLTIMKIA